jgi:cell wall-associated NlpC family hydrolase
MSGSRRVTSERGQVAPAVVAVLVLVALGAGVLVQLGRIGAGGGHAQRAADLAAIAAADALARDPWAAPATLRTAAEAVARANGGAVERLRVLARAGVPSGVEVEVSVPVEARLPAAGAVRERVVARARAAVAFRATLPAASFRPVALGGARGRAAVVAAAAAQVGWPYVWGGESRAEGGFDCSGLVDFAYRAAGYALPGRPTAADLWRMATPIAAAALVPGDLVFVGAPSGAPHHVGLYAGAGTVVVARHRGAPVSFQPLRAGGWDGFGRLLPADAELGEAHAAPVDAAARRHDVPPHVVGAMVRLGLAADADAAAAALAAAMAAHPGDLEAAVAAAVGSPSAAALVLRDASGPALGDGFTSHVRLVPVPRAEPRPASAAAGVQPGRAGGVAGTGDAGALGGATGPPGNEATRALGAAPGETRDDRGGRGLTIARPDAEGLVPALLDGAETVLHQLAARGTPASLQAAAAIRSFARLGLAAAVLLVPDPELADGLSFVGSVWDAAAAARDLLAVWGTTGLQLGRLGLWAARANVAGGVFSTVVLAGAALTARRRRDRVSNGALAVGTAMTTAGMATLGGSLFALGATSAVLPPVALALIVTGGVVCAGAYAYRHWPAICRAAAGARRLAGRAARATLDAVSGASSGARRIVDVIAARPW